MTSVVTTVALTQTTQVTVTTTVTTSSTCSTYAPYATNGAFAGHALGRNAGNVFVFQPGMANPQLLVVGNDGRVTDPSNPASYVAYTDASKSTLGFVGYTDPASYGFTPLVCRVGDPLNQSGILPLYCNGGIFETCPNDSTLYFASSLTAGCTESDIGVFVAC